MYNIGNYISGKVDNITKNKIIVHDPSIGEEIAYVSDSDSNDLEKLITSSKKNLLNWSSSTPLKRSRILAKYKILIEKNFDELAKLVSQEHGKTLDDAKGSITRGLEVVEFATGFHICLKVNFQ